jgi:hypothetical protein
MFTEPFPVPWPLAPSLIHGFLRQQKSIGKLKMA